MSANLKVNNFPELIKTARTDPAAGIRIVRVTGDDPMGLYVAELGPHRSVTAHSPCSGSKIYQIVHEEGKIHTGTPSSHGAVDWNVPVDVRSGDCFTIQEREAHQRENTASSAMIAIFVCPADPVGKDRFIVQGAVPH
jgi:mannose-6-phosphate isomerase-like protein (cupin superfamily)